MWCVTGEMVWGEHLSRKVRAGAPEQLQRCRCGLTASTPGNAAPGLQQGAQGPAANMEDLFYAKVSFEAGRKRFEVEMTTTGRGSSNLGEFRAHGQLPGKGALLDLRIEEELLGNVKVGQLLVCETVEFRILRGDSGTKGRTTTLSLKSRLWPLKGSACDMVLEIAASRKAS